MLYKDLIDYEPKPVLFIEDEATMDILRNPLYTPILSILRHGIKTLKEIKDEYKNHTKKTEIPSDKSLYRHLKQLKDAGLIAEAGRRVYTEQTLTEKLFSRTAYFFYSRPSDLEKRNREQHQRQAELLAKLFKITLNIPQPPSEGMLKITDRIKLSSINSHDDLFKNHVEELVKLFENVTATDLQAVVEMYWIIKLMLGKSEFDEDFKKYLKVT